MGPGRIIVGPGKSRYAGHQPRAERARGPRPSPGGFPLESYPVPATVWESHFETFRSVFSGYLAGLI